MFFACIFVAHVALRAVISLAPRGGASVISLFCVFVNGFAGGAYRYAILYGGFHNLCHLPFASFPTSIPSVGSLWRASHLPQAIHTTTIFASATLNVALDNYYRTNGVEEEYMVEQ